MKLREFSVTGRYLPIYAAAGIAVIPLLVRNASYIDILAQAGLYSILALSLNIIVGYAGLLNLGHAAFYAVGAYTYALLASGQFGIHVPSWILFPLCAASSAAAGFLLGLPVLRLRGDYLAIVTLGFGEIVRITLNNLTFVTNGPNGIINVDHPVLFGWNFGVNVVPYYYLFWAAVGVTVFGMRRLENSRVGRAWMAIREDEMAAQAQGINTTALKLMAFSAGAAIAGVCGGLYACKQGHVAPESFSFMDSVMMLSMVVLGGMGTVRGPILGAVIMTILPYMLLGLQTYRMLLFGAALIAMMLFRPQGLLGRRGGLAA